MILLLRKMTTRIIYALFLLLTIACGSKAQVDFDQYFENKTLRIDYLMGGDANSQSIFLKELREEPYWGGSTTNLIDKFGYGNFRFKLLDDTSGKLLYSKGFNSLFQEWQSTPEAKKLHRAFYQVNVMPYPKNKVRFVLEKRNKNGEMVKIWEYRIDPKNYFIQKEALTKYVVTKIYGEGKPNKSVDIAFIAEGYTAQEMDKFRADVKRIAGYIFEVEPFKKYQKRFNIYAIASPSQESGTDIPGEHIYKNTILNTGYYTFDIERYLTTFDLKTIHDISANVPYDQIFILINTSKYGGGGFYNYYTCCSADNRLTYEVSSHEFGHGYVALADEYYNSSTAYEDYYNLKVEPYEPNITTLVDFDKKWKDLVKKGTPIPTPRTKEYEKTLGAFEGGGYVAKGIYSPMQDCKMKSNRVKTFCPACYRAVERMIKFTIGE